MNSANPTASYVYPGGELGVFESAVRWKEYWTRTVMPYIGGDVVEVGAGIGANLLYLTRASFHTWLCLEPDPELHRLLGDAVRRLERGGAVSTRNCTLGDAGLPPGSVDTILYCDVLEHIADDRAEVALATRTLARGGHLVVVAPAWQFLYSPFDKAIGHYRRYSAASLLGLADPALELATCHYLDSVGMLASAVNRYVTRREQPTRGSIALWDGWMVPASRWFDRLVGHRFGKTVIAVWRRT